MKKLSDEEFLEAFINLVREQVDLFEKNQNLINQNMKNWHSNNCHLPWEQCKREFQRMFAISFTDIHETNMYKRHLEKHKPQQN